METLMPPNGDGETNPAYARASDHSANGFAARSGSPSDLCWDVSGDNRITSLDALMILQATAGAIEL